MVAQSLPATVEVAQLSRVMEVVVRKRFLEEAVELLSGAARLRAEVMRVVQPGVAGESAQ